MACEDRNGIIIGYSVRYGHSSSQSRESVNTTSRSIAMERLLIRTEYSFEVAAISADGIGVFSAPTIFETTIPTGTFRS